MRRLIMLVLGMAAAALLLLGPRPDLSTDDNRVRIRYWEKWTGVEGDQMRLIVDEFNRTVGLEKGIFVEYISMSQIDRKTLISTAAGAAPDVAGLWDVQVRQFASLDALEPLDELANARGLTRDRYKPVYYDGCSFNGRLVALPSTPWATALFYDKQLFADRAVELRAAGLDPTRAPRTLQELDQYAAALDVWTDIGGRKRIQSAGYIPMEPGWWINFTVYWFGGALLDPSGERLALDTPEIRQAYDWLRGYSQRLGKESLTEFRSGFGGISSPQNPFLTGTVAMVMQGPWMANFIEKLNPSMNRWNMTTEQIERDERLATVAQGDAESELIRMFGTPARDGDWLVFSGTRHDLRVRVASGKVEATELQLTPPEQRRKYTRWGVAPFPSARPGLDQVTYGGMDVLVIPRGSKHKREAFEFIAYINRQDVAERLNSLHCKLSPLKDVSESFFRNHPNPYIHVFDELAASQNAFALPPVTNWAEIADELSIIAERVNLQDGPTEQIIRDQAVRAEQKFVEARHRVERRQSIQTP